MIARVMRIVLQMPGPDGKLRVMNERHFTDSLRFSPRFSVLCGVLLALMAPRRGLAEPLPAATAAFDKYVVAVETRLGLQHQSPDSFVAVTDSDPQRDLRLRQGEVMIENLTPGTIADLPGALLHHWRATAFAPGATAAEFERVLRDFKEYPHRFSPEVLQAKVLAQDGDRMQADRIQADRIQATMRVRQKHVLTVVLDTTYDVTFGRLDAKDGYSTSRSTRIYEIDAPGTSHEHALSPAEEHGFLWRINTYWTYEERDGGLYMQIESVTLSRSIPTGLGWAIKPFVESVPRESLEFTLRSACKALHTN
jgi:hypothetical protein